MVKEQTRRALEEEQREEEEEAKEQPGRKEGRVTRRAADIEFNMYIPYCI